MQSDPRRSHRLFVPVLLGLVLLSICTRAQDIPVEELLENPQQYDGQPVSVVGTIANYREKISRAGNAYTTFRLQADGAAVNVFIWGHQGLGDGQRVRVQGVYRRVKRVGRYTFYNEIEAWQIRRVGKQ
ncbi:MAG: hypothetical protein NZ473_02865 [Candidatus Kapabacteria bacterium]|nr:hypothetical protein [Candidatus Kapabacteria bacterium]MCS7170009.1 hypothetical protein [Candidatus Kapabacteria bacterium]MDW7996232.1 hypothetical protein [Bacteroidota bacterium]MDW8225313.1 hypothetical protein [Bacteroidota bacterium]